MDFLPQARWETLVARAEILWRVRQFFDSRGFVEVETPVLSQDVVVDRHIDPLRTTLFRDPRSPDDGPTYWLQTSPEFCLKRLLVAAAEAEPGKPLGIFQIAKAFRGGESGRLHNPEFTMVEWYRLGDDYAAGRKLLGEFATEIIGRGEPEEVTWHGAFSAHAHVDPAAASDDALFRAATSHGYGGTADRAALIDFLLVRLVEPSLGSPRPTILYDYPADQAALARVRQGTSGEPAVAERFELYVDGIELANGYHELLDPAILRARNEAQNAARIQDGKYPVPSDSRLLAAMEHGLPACSGCALGFDRLVMLMLRKDSINEVMAFPEDRA